MIRRRWLAAAAVCVLALAAGAAIAGNGSTNDKTFEFTVGLWGDLPYNDEQAQTGVPNLVADMNSSDISFSIHDGDLKAGSAIAGSKTPTDCSDAMYAQALDFLNSFEKPSFFPGDNDWTDCDARSTARTTSSSGSSTSARCSSRTTAHSARRR